jgi:glycerophosphoryl diester phosphodiesterase
MVDFVLIAHRGFSSKAPENTIAAFDLAVEQGFANIELDVQLTADGELVVIHDASVGRTTGGKGQVNSLTLGELQALDAGSWFSPQFSNARIPTLQSVLERYIGRIHLHLELKSSEAKLASKVTALLKDHGWLSGLKNNDPFGVPGLTITSANMEQIERSLKLLPDIPHHWLCWDLSDQIIETALAKGFKGLGITPAAARRQLIEIARSNGLIVRGLGVKTDDDIRALITAGAQGTTTDWLDRGMLIKKELII